LYQESIRTKETISPVYYTPIDFNLYREIMMNIIFVFVVITVAAESPCNQVPFVNRAGWDAREPTSITNLTGESLSFYVIHHTYEPPK
jgi:hypothetical protein